MKRLKKLGALLGILVVCCIATYALTHYEEKQEQIRSSEAVILEIDGGSVTSLAWKYEAEEDALSFYKENGIWYYAEDAAFPVSEEKVMDILSHFEAFSSSFCIENVEDYSQYGLNEPECTLTIGTGEDTTTIKLGAYSKMDEQRYVDIGDGNVYLVPEDPVDYVTSSVSNMILDDTTPGFETVVDIRFEGAENYIIQRMEDTDYSYSDEDVYYVQQNGKYLPLDTTNVTSYLNTITTLDLLDYVTYNATEEELESYGLADPELTITVNYTYTDEQGEKDENGDKPIISDTCVIHIGRNAEELAAAQEADANGEELEDVSAYVRVGESQIVYSLDSLDYDTLAGASYEDLRHKEVFWAEFDDVTRIDITLEDAQHTLTSRIDPEDEDSRLWYYGQREESEEATEETTDETTEEPQEPETLDISDLKSAIKVLYANSFTDEAPSGKEEIRLTLHLDNETFPEVEIVLYRYSGSECLAVVDGQSVSLVARSSVMELVEAVQSIVLNQM